MHRNIKRNLSLTLISNKIYCLKKLVDTPLQRSMDNELLKNSGKTICWRKLNPCDAAEVTKLVEGSFYFKEPTSMALCHCHLLKFISECGKVFNLVILACLDAKYVP